MTSQEIAEHNRKFPVPGFVSGKSGPVAESHSATALVPGQAVREVGKGGLQEQIADFCRKQWPPWQCSNPRHDKPTTIKKGWCDFVIAASEGRTFYIECKAKGKKRTQEQNEFSHQMANLGHEVFLCFSMDDFLAVISPEK